MGVNKDHYTELLGLGLGLGLGGGLGLGARGRARALPVFSESKDCKVVAKVTVDLKIKEMILIEEKLVDDEITSTSSPSSVWTTSTDTCRF